MFFVSKQSKILFLRKDVLDLKNNKTILENINISLKSGSILILKGKNGSGKTSLLLKLNDVFSYFNYSFNKITNLMNFFGLTNLLNKFFINITLILKFKVITDKILFLSFGYKKYYFILLNWCIKKQYFFFDEPFNGLDKYLLCKINSIFVYIHTIKSIQIKSYHNKTRNSAFSLIFLD